MAEPVARRLAGRYEVRSLIGRGGMAEVHLGFDTRLSRVIAIKMLRRDLALDSIFQARFRREAQSAASLNHPNIVAVYDTGEEMIEDAQGRAISIPFIVMEYVEGHTVKELISDGMPVPINEAIEIVGGVLQALEYSHAAHLVHRDIKPGNIMLTNDGKVKVMDFGIARALTDSQATMTQTNAVVGTAQYLSPEQARGEQVDARSDLYSTGVVLFELLTGRPPFKGDSAVAVAYQHVGQMPPIPSSITADIPDALDRVVMKALAKDRDQRYASADAMLADLMRVSRGLGVSAPETSVWMGQTPRQDQTAATIPLSAAASPTSTVIANPARQGQGQGAQGPAPTPANGANEEDEARARKRRAVLIGSLIALALLVIGSSVYALANWKGKPATAAVPNVVGYTQAEAKAQVESAGFTWAIAADRVASDSVAEGSVVSTNPPGGEQAEEGSTITATLSSGPDSVAVPDSLVGMSPDDAKRAVEAVGLKWEVSSDRVASDEVGEGKVAKVNPSSASKVKAGSTVTGYLSSGSDTVTVPDLSGMKQEQARSALENVGLKLGTVDFTDDSEQPKDQIVYSDPEAGSSAQKGAKVNVTISSGNNQVTIPTVVGTSAEDAKAALEGVGLKPNMTEVDSDKPKGQVVSIDPAEGQKVNKGTQVNVKVSKGKGNGTPTPTPTSR